MCVVYQRGEWLSRGQLRNSVAEDDKADHRDRDHDEGAVDDPSKVDHVFVLHVCIIHPSGQIASPSVVFFAVVSRCPA